MTRETGPKAGSQIAPSSSINRQANTAVAVEVLPRLHAIESLALRAALGLDDLDRGDVLVGIAELVANAQRWASC